MDARDEPTTPAMRYDPQSDHIVDSNDELIAEFNPMGELTLAGQDVNALGHKMAAADVMYDALGEASAFLIEKFGPMTRRFDRSMWVNQTAFAVYEKINTAMQQADGE